MLIIAYRFHVVPRRHNDFCHAWRAAEDTLQKVIGLRRCHLHPPRHRRLPFTLVLKWDNEFSFDRFTRTWVGVWAINGMGLQGNDFFAPTQTNIDAARIDHRQQRAA